MSRLRNHFRRVPQHDSAFAIAGLIGILTISIPVFIVIGLGLPTGLGLSIDIPFMTITGLLLIILVIFLISNILVIIRIRMPRFLISGLISVFALMSVALNHANISYWGASILSIAIIVLGFLTGTTIYMMVIPLRSRLLNVCYIGSSLLLLLFVMNWLFDLVPIHSPAYEKQRLPLIEGSSIHADTPGKMGNYSYLSFTYGSGMDRHRYEFGKGTSIITKSVDGSALINKWSRIRQMFWGFDEKGLPVNGRVWMPVGKGPYPLVLIVHGNHLMEDFSDHGYAYLGELLASRGFIAVSIDENFINYSVWSGGLSNDMELRSWVILQHLREITKLGLSPNNPFSLKVDMKNIALVGHSRGGQAAVLAAHSGEIDYNIKAIVAIAPTDRLEDKKYLKLNNINYLLLQGSQDADVSSFTGDRQYERVSFTDGEYKFKTSLYIHGANHSQFNTEWGSLDLSLPTGILLNQRDIMDGDEQRRIAKTYIAAFLETTLMNKRTYLPMFRDYRKAAQWLPNTTYMNRFEDSEFIRVSDFEEDNNRTTTSVPNGTVVGSGLTSWTENELEDRQKVSKQNRGVYLSWNGQEGRYELTLPDKGMINHITAASSLTFSLANISESSNINIILEIQTTDGIKIHRPLNQFQPIPPAIHTQFTKAAFLDSVVRKGRYGASTEPVFQTFIIPLREFIKGHDEFKPNQIKFIRFIFNPKREGNIILDDIGFYEAVL
jgi:hypothetical protein